MELTREELLKGYELLRKHQACQQSANPPPVVTSKPILLGDRIESALISIGITKERYAAFKTKIGAPPVDGCLPCEQRQEALNSADQWMRDAASELGQKAADAIATIWAPIGWLTSRKKEED